MADIRGSGVSLLHRLFGVDKPIIAMLHLPAMPGRPRHDRAAGMAHLVDTVGRDLEALQGAGRRRLPLLQRGRPPLPDRRRTGDAVAGMAAVIGQVRSTVSRPFGVNLVWDPVASLAVARATGAAFVREVFTGVFESDLGIMRPDFGAIAAYREQHRRRARSRCSATSRPSSRAASATARSPTRARSAAFLGVDAILISGQITGTSTSRSRAARGQERPSRTCPCSPTPACARRPSTRCWPIADGVFVGTSLKRDGVTWNGVDPERASRFMAAVHRRARRGSGLRWRKHGSTSSATCTARTCASGSS